MRSLYSQSTASTTSDPASTLISQLNDTIESLTTEVSKWQNKYELAKKTSEMYRSKLNRLLKKKIKSPIANDSNSLLSLLSKRNKYCGNRFNEMQKMYALSLWHSSPKCYLILYKTLTLPSISTLRKTMNIIKLMPGFHDIIFDALKDKCEKLSIKDKLILIAFDEMSLKSDLKYNVKHDLLDGLHNTGDGEISKYIANYVTVFMIKSLSGTWKQPVGYFFTSGVMPADLIIVKLKQCIDRVINCGLMPKLMICDQGPSNRGCITKLGININKPFFVYTNMKIFFMFDPPHLIKSIRNGLSKGFMFENNKVSMEVIQKCYDIKSNSKLPLAPKLNIKHIQLKSFSKMRVNLACELLSNSVALGIETLVIVKLIEGDALYTSHFCKFFNNLFDIFNSSLSNKNIVYKNPLNNNIDSITFLQNSVNILNNIKYCDNKYTDQLPCLLGWRLNVNSLLLFLEDEIIVNNPFSIELNKFNQDFVENFFSRMRSRGGNRDNPTPMEFASDYRAISVDSLFVKIKGSNCELDAGEFLLKLNSYIDNTHNAPPITNTSLAVYLEPDLNISIIDDNSLHLLCSNIIQICYSKFKCNDCLNLLSIESSNVFTAGSVRLMLDENSSKYYPSPLFYNYIKNLFTCFRNNIMSILYKNEIYIKFVNLIYTNNFIFKYCDICICINDFVLHVFFIFQMKYLLRKENTEFTVDTKSKSKQNRKYLKLCHI